MKRIFLLLTCLLLVVFSFSQNEGNKHRTRSRFSGTVQFSGFSVGGTSDVTGNLIDFNDQRGIYFANGIQPGFIAWDNQGNRWEVMVVNSSNLIQANVDLRDINNSGSLPLGVGFVEDPTRKLGFSLMVPDNSVGVSSVLKSRVESHNFMIIDSLINDISNRCKVSEVMADFGLNARESYRKIFLDSACTTVHFDNPNVTDSFYVYHFERTSAISNRKGKTVYIDKGVKVQLDTFPDGAGDADTAYVSPYSGGFDANAVFSYLRVDNLNFINEGIINASNIPGNVPLGDPQNIRRSQHGIKLDDCDFGNVKGGTLEDCWFGVFVVGGTDNVIEDVIAIGTDTGALGARRLAGGNDEFCCGDFQNAAVTLSGSNKNSLLSNIYADGYSEIIDLNPPVFNPVIINPRGKDIYESGFETSGAIGFNLYGLTCTNCKVGLQLSPYTNKSAIGNVYGANIEYNSSAPWWLKDGTAGSVVGYRNTFQSNAYGVTVNLFSGVDYVNKAAEVKFTIDQSSNTYGPIKGRNIINIFSDGSFFQDNAIIESFGSDLEVSFDGVLSDNQALVDLRKGTGQTKVIEAINNNPGAVNTSVIRAGAKDNTIMRYFVSDDIEGFTDTIQASVTALIEPIYPDRVTPTLPTDRSDIILALFPDANYRYVFGDSITGWESAVADRGVSVETPVKPVFYGDTTGIKFNANANLGNGTLDNVIDWDNHRVTFRFRVDTMGTGQKTLYRWGGNSPYRFKLDASGLYFQTTATGWTNQTVVTPISEGVWYTISLIINADNLVIRFGTDGSVSEVLNYTAAQAMATSNGNFSMNARSDTTEGNAKTFSSFMIVNGPGSENNFATDEAFIQGL